MISDQLFQNQDLSRKHEKTWSHTRSPSTGLGSLEAPQLNGPAYGVNSTGQAENTENWATDPPQGRRASPHRQKQTLSPVPPKAGLEPQRHTSKEAPSQKPRNAGLPVPKHWEMGGTIQRIGKASFCPSLNWIHPITFERGSRLSSSTLDFSVSRATVRERA